MDDLDEHSERLAHYAIQRTKSGNRLSGRLKHIEEHAAEIENIAKKIQQHAQNMRRKY